MLRARVSRVARISTLCISRARLTRATDAPFRRDDLGATPSTVFREPQLAQNLHN